MLKPSVFGKQLRLVAFLGCLTQHFLHAIYLDFGLQRLEVAVRYSPRLLLLSLAAPHSLGSSQGVPVLICPLSFLICSLSLFLSGNKALLFPPISSELHSAISSDHALARLIFSLGWLKVRIRASMSVGKVTLISRLEQRLLTLYLTFK